MRVGEASSHEYRNLKPLLEHEDTPSYLMVIPY